MATIRNLIIRISVSENTDKGIRKVTTSLRETNREIDQADKGSSRFGGTLSKLGRTSMTGLTRGLSAVAAGTKQAAVGILAVGSAAAALNTATQAGVALAPLLGGLALLPAVAVSAATSIGVLKVATSGLSDGFKDAMKPGTKPGDLAKELKYVSPAARSVALELLKLQPTLLGIRNTIQQALFKPLVGQLTSLAKVLGGPIKTGAAGVAAEFGLAGRKIADFAKQSKTVELVKAAFGQTQQAIANVLPALDPLLKGFRALATEGLSFLPRIGTAIGQIGTKFGDWLQKMVASGQATKWINNFFATLTQLGGVLKSVGGILSSVFSAASAAGSGFLGVLGTALGKLNAFLKTSAGKSALVSIFQGLAAAGEAVGPVIAALVTGLGTLAGPVGRLAAVLGPILTDAINALAPALAALEPGLRAIFAGVGAAVQVLAPVLPQVAGALSQVVVALAPLLPLAAQAVVALAPLLPLAVQLAGLLAQQLSAALLELTAVLGPVITSIAGALVPILPQLTQAFALWAAALIPVAGLLGQQLGQALRLVLPQLIAIVPQLLQGLVPAMIQLLVAITPLLPQLVTLGIILAENFAQALPSLIPLITDLVTLMAQWTQIMAPILGFILQISTALAANLGDSVNIVVGIVGSGLQLVAGWFGWLFDVLLGHSIIPDIVNGIGAWFGRLPGLVVGIFTSMATGALSVASSMLSSLSRIPGMIGGFFSGAGSMLYNAGRNIVIGLWNGVVSLWNWLVGKFRSLTNLIPHIKGPPERDRRLLTPAGIAIMQSLGAGITSQIPALRTTLAGVTDVVSGGVTPSWAAPAGVAATAGSGATGGSGGVDAKTLGQAVKTAIDGLTVHMDGKPVGQIVSRYVGQNTDLRRRTG